MKITIISDQHGRVGKYNSIIKDTESRDVDFSLQLGDMGYKKEYDWLIKYLRKIRREKIILAGDFNIAHQEIDLARPKDNVKNIMFTPKERKQIDQIIKLGFIDSFRKFHQKGGHYTWWAYIRNCRERNIGWRIDYAFASKSLTPKLRKAFILPKVKGSDHCPIGIEISPNI